MPLLVAWLAPAGLVVVAGGGIHASTHTCNPGCEQPGDVLLQTSVEASVARNREAPGSGDNVAPAGDGPRLADVDSVLSKASQSIQEVSEQADKMRQSISDQEEATKIALSQQRQKYESQLAVLQQQCNELEESNKAVQSSVDELIPANRALADDIRSMRWGKDVVRKMLTALKPKVIMAQLFVNESLQLVNAEREDELQEPQSFTPPTLEHLLMVAGDDLLKNPDVEEAHKAALMQTTGARSQEKNVVEGALDNPEDMVEGLTQRLNDISHAESEGEGSLKSHFVALTSKQDQIRNELLETQQKLNSSRNSQLRLQAELSRSKQRLQDLRGTLHERTAGLQLFVRDVGNDIDNVLRKSVSSVEGQAMSAMQTSASTGPASMASSAYQSLANAMESAMSMASSSMKEFAHEANSVKKRLSEQETSSKQGLTDMKARFEAQLEEMSKRNHELQASVEPLRSQLVSAQQDNKALQDQITTTRAGTHELQVAFTDVWPKMHMAAQYIDEALLATADESTSDGGDLTLDHLLDLTAQGGGADLGAGAAAVLLQGSRTIVHRFTEVPAAVPVVTSEDLVDGMERRIRELVQAEKEGEATLKEQYETLAEESDKQRAQLQAEVNGINDQASKQESLKASLIETRQKVNSMYTELRKRLAGFKSFTMKVDEAISKGLHMGKLDGEPPAVVAKAAVPPAAGPTITSDTIAGTPTLL